MPYKIFPLFSLLLLTVPLFGQIDTSWSTLESSISNKNQLALVDLQLARITGKSWQQHDYISVARSLFDRMLVRDQRSEDSLYFRNSAFIDSLLQQSTTPAELKQLLHLMQARRIAIFCLRRLRFNKERYETPDLICNYAAYDGKRLDSVTHFHFQQALIAGSKLENADPAALLWLADDPLLFLYKPSWLDVVLADEIGYEESKPMQGSKWDIGTKEWMQLSPKGFIDSLISQSTIGNRHNLGKIFAQWLSCRKAYPNAFYFIESLARKSFFQRFSEDTTASNYYETYLKDRSEDSIPEAKAFAIYQLCLLWNHEALETEELPAQETEWYHKVIPPFRKNYKYTPQRALQLYEQNKPLFIRFSLLGQILATMRLNILSTALHMTMQEFNTPYEPMLARVSYKNTSELYYRIFSLTQDEEFPLNKKDIDIYLRKLPPIKEIKVGLPLPPDHALHHTFLKLEGLPAGRYCLLFSSQPATDTSRSVNWVSVHVTSMATLVMDNRVYVLDKQTGKGLPGVKIQAIKQNRKDTLIERLTTNGEGFAQVGQSGNLQLRLNREGDTLQQAVDIDPQDLDDVLDDSSFESAEFFFTNNARLFVYTDRGIYRPGQMLHIKAILLTKDAQNGETILFNEKNTRSGWGRKGFDRWLKKDKPQLYIKDPLGQTIDSLLIQPNEFGSFSASVRLPNNAPTGQWQVDSWDIETQFGTFNVEEYKRPTFEVKVLPPTGTWEPGEQAEFVVRVRSFTGASMDNSSLQYSINKDGRFLQENTGKIGQDGTLHIPIMDTLARLRPMSDSVDWNIRYSLVVKVTDITGESHSTEGDIKVSSQPVRIRLSPQATYLVDDIPTLYIGAKDPNGLTLLKKLDVQVLRKQTGHSLYQNDYSDFADQWLYPVSDLEATFPAIRFRDSIHESHSRLIYTTSLNTGNGDKLQIPKGLLTSGEYEVIVTCREGNKLLGRNQAVWTILDAGSQEWVKGDKSSLYVPIAHCKRGELLRFYTGNAFDSSHVFVQLKCYAIRHGHLRVISTIFERTLPRGVHEWSWLIPRQATDQVGIMTYYIRNNHIYQHHDNVSIQSDAVTPSIRIDQFRDQLAPGATTSFAVSVRSRNTAVASELMSTIYDASLDQLTTNRWKLPYPPYRRDLRGSWASLMNWIATKSVFEDYPLDDTSRPARSLWWLSNATASQYAIASSSTILARRAYYPNLLSLLDGRVPGLNISQTPGIDDVVVKGYYGTTTQRLTTGSIVTIRGADLPALDKGALVILDGVPFTGDIHSIKLSAITNGYYLQGVDAKSLFGSRAGHGVLLLSTKGEIKLPPRPEPVIKVRNNFTETAFFSPAIYASRKGYYTFTCTLPESVTEWTWKMLATTNSAQFSMVERKFNTKLPFIVQPHMPRILYQGDQILLQSRISNLDSMAVSGTAVCSLEDALTGKDLTPILTSMSQSSFSIPAHRDSTISFLVKVPSRQIHPLKITIKAYTSAYTDAEAHTIPVLSTRIFARKVLPFRLGSGKDSSFRAPLPFDTDSLSGIGISITPAPQAGLLFSLPWLSNYSFDCAEQTFNKMVANCIAIDMMRTDQHLRSSWNNAMNKNKNLANISATPEDPIMKTMPWLSLSRQTERQQRQLTELLDTARSAMAIEGYLSRLYSLQNLDGGLAWFDGGKSDPYISAYVLAGFAKLEMQHWRFTSSVTANLDGFIERLLHFCDESFSESPSLFYTYARSLWREHYPVRPELRMAIQKCLTHEWESSEKKGLYQQALLIIGTFAFFDSQHTFLKKAQYQLESIRQSAISDEYNGVRWKGFSEEDDLNVSSEETVALLAEALEKSPKNVDLQAGLLKWLLNTHTDHHWQTTKATAAVIRLLRQENGRISPALQELQVHLSDSISTLSDDPLSGTPFLFRPVKGNPGEITLHNSGPTEAAGQLISYYFTNSDKPDHLNTMVRLYKSLYRYVDTQRGWTLVADSGLIQSGDRLKMVLTLETPKPLRYVHIEDARAAALEPVDIHSGYLYGNGFPIYQSVRDMGYQFFSDFIPSGRWEISYEVSVEQQGLFTNGPAVLECMYNPTVTAYSNSCKFIVQKL